MIRYCDAMYLYEEDAVDNSRNIDEMIGSCDVMLEYVDDAVSLLTR